MRFFVLVFAVCAVISSVGQAQWLETTIFLPDSFGGLTYVGAIGCNPERGEFLVGGTWGDCVLAVDCSTGRKVERIPAGMEVSSISYNGAERKVYAGGLVSQDITVIDAATDSVVTVVSPGHEVAVLCYDESGGKLYSAGDAGIEGRLAVIDCTGDSLLSVVEVEPNPSSLCHASGPDKLYCAHNFGNCVTVLDCAADTVLAVVSVGTGPSGLCYDPVGEKVYCSNFGTEWFPDSTVTVIDGTADTVIATIVTGARPAGLCYNPVNRCVYCARATGHVTVVDCAADTVVADVEVAHSAHRVCCNPLEHKVYCGYYEGVAVVDCATNEVIADVPAHGTPLLCFSPTLNAVGFAGSWTREDEIGVIDGTTNQVRARVAIRAALPEHICYSSGSHKVYCTSWGDSVLTTVDAATNRLLSHIDLQLSPYALCYCPDGDKVYCFGIRGSFRWLAAVACADDSVLGSFAFPAPPTSHCEMCHSPGSNKLYLSFIYDSIVVAVDCDRDSVLKTLHVGAYPRGICHNPVNDRIYTANNGSCDVTVIDCASDSVVASIPVYCEPAVLCHNPDDNLVYCGNEYGCVSVIDAARNLPLGGIVAGGSCGGLCWNPHDRKVYCANPGDSTVTVFDPLGDTILATVRTERGAGVLHYNPVNNTVYCLNGGGTPYSRVVGRWVTLIDGTTDDVLGHLPVGSEPVAMAWNPFENRTYVACYRGSCISVIRDSMPGAIEEGRTPHAGRLAPGPTVVRGTLRTAFSRQHPANRAELLDISGRKVMELRPGENDIRCLSPGVYFVHSSLDTWRSPLVTKVVVAR
ncbi:hypothetical protein JXD38_10055 [candidate division WOR-3 bacterium]|nr:hypothetical protein [candidate division WOR-3 bacterium]